MPTELEPAPRKIPVLRIVLGLTGIFLFTLIILMVWPKPAKERTVVIGDVSKFQETYIILQPQVLFTADKNVIWNGTMVLAWGEAMAKLNGQLHLVNPSPEAELLNRQEFTKADVDPESYIAIADFKTNHVDEKIHAEKEQKFNDAVIPQWLPPPTPGPPFGDFVIYAYLSKNVVSPTPFYENLPMKFGKEQVANFGFGLGEGSGKVPPELTSQVKVLSYVAENNFIIQLKTKNDQDQFIMAMVTPEKTLQATINAVLEASKFDNDWGVSGDSKLAIPKINFDLSTHFEKFENQYITSGVRIAETSEEIRFQLDQNGVHPKPEANAPASTDSNGGSSTATPVRLIFDKPFLIILKRASSPKPYLVLWVGNPIILTPP